MPAFSHGLIKISLVFKLCCIRLIKIFLTHVSVIKLLIDVISLLTPWVRFPDMNIHDGLLYSYTIHNHQQKRQTDDLIFSGRSLIKIRQRTGHKSDPSGTTDRTGTRSEA